MAVVAFCECGCGEPAPLSSRTRNDRGQKKGEPVRFVKGHRFRIGMKGSENPAWDGGRRIHDNGYVVVWVGKDHPMAGARGTVYEHRLVMAEYLGRMLDPTEHVHHLLPCEGGTGDITDNRIENLKLFASNSEHKLHHSKLSKIPLWES